MSKLITEIQVRMNEVRKNNTIANLLETLKDIKGKLSEAEKEKNTDLTDAECIIVISKMAKNRQQSIDAFLKADRMDLAQKETFELDILEEYLPKKMDNTEIKEKVLKIMSENNFTDMKHFGSIMKTFKGEYPSVDGGVVSKIVKSLL